MSDLTPRRSTRARRSVTRSMSVESSASSQHVEEGERTPTATAKRGDADGNASGSSSIKAKRSNNGRSYSRASRGKRTTTLGGVQEEFNQEEQEEQEDQQASIGSDIESDSDQVASPLLSTANAQELAEEEAKPTSSNPSSSLPHPPSVGGRLVLRRRVLGFLSGIGPILRPLLILSSIILFLLLASPSPPFSRNTYVDENALQPGSANVKWDWEQVGWSDEISHLIRGVGSKSSQERSDLLQDQLTSFGLRAYTQEYTFSLPGETKVRGLNTYARWKSPRSDGREAVVIAASWLSRWDGHNDPDLQGDQEQQSEEQARAGSSYSHGVHRVNVRGVSLVLSLARYLSKEMHSSKDITFVFSDGYMEGMQAWSNAYFGVDQSNLESETVYESGSTIWNAIAIDYPSDSFSSLTLLHQGIDGQLPNMDVLNTVVRVADRLGRIKIELPGDTGGDFDHLERSSGGGWGLIGEYLEEYLGWGYRGVAKYKRGMNVVAKQMKDQTLCQPSGLHGLFQRFHVDAITLYANPSKGPYGFWQLGRVMESTLRSFSNLLERLHHSQFFYLLTTPEKFIQLGVYLPVVILLSVVFTLTGIFIWMHEGTEASRRKVVFVNLLASDASTQGKDDVPLEYPTHTDLEMDLSLLAMGDASRLVEHLAILSQQSRPVVFALTLMGGCHLIGWILFDIVSRQPLGCATRGLFECTSLRYVTLLSLLGPLWLAFLTIIIHRGRLQSQTIPYDATRRTISVARLLHSFTLLETGLITAVLSVLNFSTATTIAFVLILPLYSLNLPQTGVQVTIDSGERVHLPWISRTSTPTRLYTLVSSGVLLGVLLPWNTLWVLEWIQPGLQEGFLSLVDTLLWDWEITRTSFLPILFLAYAPVVLQAGLAGLLVTFG
ncbi:unnamed protein product [Sympodiomycopsis kandeliae]